MRKIGTYLILLLLLLLPQSVRAVDVTDKLYIDIQVEEEGSIFVREIAVLNGSYNGRIRSIDFRNSKLPILDGSSFDFERNAFYNGSSLTDLKIYDIKNKNAIAYDSFDDLNQEFRLVTSANKGAYGVYTLEKRYDGIDLMIFNPSSTNTAFYMEYRVHDVVVKHNDIAEIYWNLLGDSYEEAVKDFKVFVHLPGADDDYRVFLHGPLYGSSERTNNRLATLSFTDLDPYESVTLRLLFDKNLITSTKYSNINAKEDILAIENQYAIEANQARNNARTMIIILVGIALIWFLALSIWHIYIYWKYDRKIKTSFDQTYYRDFPLDYGPWVIDYLMKKKITTNSFSATILDLIRKKRITMETFPIRKGKDKGYLFKKNGAFEDLTGPEKTVMSLLFTTISKDHEKVTLDEIKRFGDTESEAREFLSEYHLFKSEALDEAKKEEFFQNLYGYRIASSILSFFLLQYLLFVAMVLDLGFLSLIAFVFFIGTLIYVCTKKFRTQKGKTQYAMWMAHKRFLLDFGRFQEKEVPDIHLWDRYLVTATVLGCADEVQKSMKIQLENMEMLNSESMTPTEELIHIHMVYDLVNLNMATAITKTTNQAISTSNTRIASSSSSSSGGFGGGSVGGGGFGGGGGGGGRF